MISPVHNHPHAYAGNAYGGAAAAGTVYAQPVYPDPRPRNAQVIPRAVPVSQVPVSPPAPLLRPIPIAEERFSSAGFLTATLALASAGSIGANMVEVRNGGMTRNQAVVNGLAKGAAATLILAVTPKQTVAHIALTAAALAGAGYGIDWIMKSNCSPACTGRGCPSKVE